jgi:hypothetical protein
VAFAQAENNHRNAGCAHGNDHGANNNDDLEGLA